MLRLSRLTRHSATSIRSTTRHNEVTRLAQIQYPAWRGPATRRFGSARPRCQAVAEPPIVHAESQHHHPLGHDTDFTKTLPVACPGCGALSQTVEAETPGFYSPKQRNVASERRQKKQDEDAVFAEAMARLSASNAAPELVHVTATEAAPVKSSRPSLCDRCHGLVYQSKAQSILHPSMESIQSIIEASPHKNNHIYHVLDAADFPMSLIPNLVSRLNLPRLRTRNRRSKSNKQYINGRSADVSFIITRSDLLAPRKEAVDRMMPYLQEVLRESLGRAGRNLRLGNVRCVSAKRGWWTPQVKEEIWIRGGAGWVVGKVNVGKSALFEVVFPKGRTNVEKEEAKLRELRQRNSGNASNNEESLVSGDQSNTQAGATAGIGDCMMEASESQMDEFDATGSDGSLETAQLQSIEDTEQPAQALEVEEDDQMDDEDEISLLPPAQKETQYPHMPIISALPGTTAAPIRIPFGNGKGELIDLPGIMRSSMETHVKPEHHASLVMKSRVVPEQHTLKPGQSLLIGGIIRITPKTDDLTFLAYPFTPLHPHATGNQKAVAIQTGVNEDGTPYTGNVENIGTDKAKGRVRSAGTFKLEWDVTKKRTGSLTDKTAGKQKIADLPFVVYSADILIEGVGWVELTCQVRSRKKSLIPDALSAGFGDNVRNEAPVPEVEVFTPKGKFIGVRQPMNAWVTGGPNKLAKHAQKTRPRMSMSYHRRMEGGKKGGRTMNPIPE